MFRLTAGRGGIGNRVRSPDTGLQIWKFLQLTGDALVSTFSGMLLSLFLFPILGCGGFVADRL
jgi:hypothetical protein